jgi:hypothetical protein
MLDYLLNTAQAFEREHGIAPDVIINTLHYEQLTRYNPELFAPGNRLQPGFRLVIVPANVLAHPAASLLAARRAWPVDGGMLEPDVNDVAGWRRGDAVVARL